MNFISVPGYGTPHDPRLRAPSRGVKVPSGEVSVMPQPSVNLQPVTLSNRSCTATGSGAPPDAHRRSDEKSMLSTPGALRSATCIVGTPM